MAEEPQSLAEPYAVDHEEGTSVWFMGSLITIKATAATTQGSFSLVEQLAPPGPAAPWHVHHEDDELFYIIEGEITGKVGDQTIEATAGSTIYLPHGIPHSYRINGSEPARLLVTTFKPGFEQYFAEVGDPAEEFDLPPAEPPTPEFMDRVNALAPKYGVEILGPPPWDE
jgi:quercetin dioxygenase-like cupin family protein